MCAKIFHNISTYPTNIIEKLIFLLCRKFIDILLLKKKLYGRKKKSFPPTKYYLFASNDVVKFK